jgi:hypothetical protein
MRSVKTNPFTQSLSFVRGNIGQMFWPLKSVETQILLSLSVRHGWKEQKKIDQGNRICNVNNYRITQKARVEKSLSPLNFVARNP